MRPSSRPSLFSFAAVCGSLALTLAAAPAAVRQPDLQTATLTVTEYAFSPHELHVVAGRPLKLTIVNNGKNTHGLRLTLSYGEVPFPMNVPPGRTITSVIDNLGEPGTYRFYCPVDDDQEKGMVGTIVVARGQP